MIFLPMVQRELRVLARKPSTYRGRWIVGGAAFGLALLLIMVMGMAGSPQGWGEKLFVILTVYAATVCIMVGLFGTADILSEERREGTLGLLFLTDLKGYDVVLGKFSAVALNALYWLLAILPVLSLPLLIGGVTFGEFLRVSLALMNLLFFALAVGTWASSRSVQLIHSLAVTAVMLAIFSALTPLFFSLLNPG
jgi:ABC-type transport system involved in multi-copper enzyme maturation permease subunit